MAISFDPANYGQLASALNGLLQAPNVGGLAGGVAVPADAFDPMGGNNPLVGPRGYFGPPPTNIAGLDPAAGTSAFSGMGAAGLTGLSPTEQAMYNQLAADDPAAAQKFLLQVKMQQIMQLAEMVSNVSKTRHNTMMSIIGNLK